jgi:hypothetical protein
VYRYKLSHTGDIERCRARLVVREYQQRKGIDFENIFAPVVSYESIRMIISVAAALDLELRQFDVKSAFLQGFIDRDVYFRPPSAELGKNVWKLVKSMYGTHQAPRCWNERQNQFLVSLGLVRSSSDLCVYTLRTGNEFFILGLFVDDGLLAGSSMEVITKMEEALGAEFECRFSDGTNSIFIGLKICRNRELKLLYLDQSRYTRKVLERFGFGQAKAFTTPMAHNVHLDKRGADEVIHT